MTKRKERLPMDKNAWLAEQFEGYTGGGRRATIKALDCTPKTGQ